MYLQNWTLSCRCCHQRSDGLYSLFFFLFFIFFLVFFLIFFRMLLRLILFLVLMGDTLDQNVVGAFLLLVARLKVFSALSPWARGCPTLTGDGSSGVSCSPSSATREVFSSSISRKGGKRMEGKFPFHDLVMIVQAYHISDVRLNEYIDFLNWSKIEMMNQKRVKTFADSFGFLY